MEIGPHVINPGQGKSKGKVCPNIDLASGKKKLTVEQLQNFMNSYILSWNSLKHIGLS